MHNGVIVVREIQHIQLAMFVFQEVILVSFKRKIYVNQMRYKVTNVIIFDIQISRPFSIATFLQT